MADAAVVGILRALLQADTAQFDAGMRKAASTSKTTEKAISGLGTEVKKLTPQAERMVKAFGGDKLLYTANSLTTAITKLGGAQKLTDAEQTKVNRTLTDAIAKYTAMGQTAPKAMLDLEKATRRSGDATAMAAGKWAAFGAVVGTFVAQMAGQAIRGMVRFGREAIDAAGHLVDLSAKTGLSTDTLQRLDVVGGQAGVTLEAFTGAAFKLGNRLAGRGDSVQAAVKALNLDLDKLLKMSPDARLFAILTALSTHVDRNRLGVELFGRTFESISAAVVENFDDIARAAKVSSDAQLQALDAAGDRWDRFVKDSKAGVRSLLGEAVLAADELRKLSLNQGWNLLGLAGLGGSGLALRALAGQGEKRATDELNERKKAADQARQAIAQQTKAEIDYVAALKAAEAELTKLNAAERRQIDAAQKSGAATDAVEELLVQYGVSASHAELALKLYNEQMRSGESASKKLAQAQKELARETAAAAKEAEEANRRWLDILGSIEAAQIKSDAEFRKAERGDGSAGLFDQSDPTAVRQTELESLEWLKSILDKKEKVAAEHRQFMNFIGERTLEDEGNRLEREKAFRNRYRTMFGQGLSNIGNAATSGLFSMFLPTGGAGKEAREEYERLKKSGTASAEAITAAFRRMKQEQSGFFDRFKQWTSGILNEFRRMIDEMLGLWIRELLGGMVKAILRSRVGQALTNFLVSSIPGLGGIGIGGAAAIPGAAAAPSTASLLGAPPAGAAASSGGTAAGGGGSGLLANAGPFALLGLGAYWTFNPPKAWDINAELDAYIKQQTKLRKGKDPNYDYRRLPSEFNALKGKSDISMFPYMQSGGGSGWYQLPKGFAMGGFVPPNVTMPAILHGGSHGELIAPVSQLMAAGAGGSRQVVFHISSFDPRTVRQIITSKEVTDSIASAFENNTGFVASRVGRSLNR